MKLPTYLMILISPMLHVMINLNFTTSLACLSNTQKLLSAPPNNSRSTRNFEHLFMKWSSLSSSFSPYCRQDFSSTRIGICLQCRPVSSASLWAPIPILVIALREAPLEINEIYSKHKCFLHVQ